MTFSKIYKSRTRDLADADAQLIGEAIDSIGPKCAPSDLVNAARDESSPLHHLFPWDDAEAAEIHRRHLAARLVRSIRVVVTDASGGTSDVRAFYPIMVAESVGHSNERRFARVSEVAVDGNLQDILLRRALAELSQWKRKYSELGTICPKLFREIDSAINSHQDWLLPDDKARLEKLRNRKGLPAVQNLA